MRHAVAIAFALTACQTRPPPASTPPPVIDAKTAVARLTPFLPAQLGTFAAAGTVEPSATPTRVQVQRRYRTPDGRTMSVELVTGDLTAELVSLDTDGEHAFGSDTPTYWKTTAIRGLRTRIAENRVNRAGSTAYVRVSPHDVAVVRVFPAISDGESASLAARLDLEGIAAPR